MIKVTNEVTIYEVDGSDAPSDTKVIVTSHWSSRKLVVIVLGGKSYSVDGFDLTAAIENALNRGMP